MREMKMYLVTAQDGRQLLTLGDCKQFVDELVEILPQFRGQMCKIRELYPPIVEVEGVVDFELEEDK